MFEINLWESLEDVGFEHEHIEDIKSLTTKKYENEIIEKLNLLPNMTGKTFFFKKISWFYYKCKHSDTCQCFKNNFNRKILFEKIKENDEAFEQLKQVVKSNRIAIEEHMEVLKVFFGFDDGDESQEIIFYVNCKQTNKRSEYLGCKRGCIADRSFRVVLAKSKKKPPWTHGKSSLNNIVRLKGVVLN